MVAGCRLQVAGCRLQVARIGASFSHGFIVAECAKNVKGARAERKFAHCSLLIVI
jgi:hypothetical protein